MTRPFRRGGGLHAGERVRTRYCYEADDCDRPLFRDALRSNSGGRGSTGNAVDRSGRATRLGTADSSGVTAAARAKRARERVRSRGSAALFASPRAVAARGAAGARAAGAPSHEAARRIPAAGVRLAGPLANRSALTQSRLGSRRKRRTVFRARREGRAADRQAGKPRRCIECSRDVERRHDAAQRHRHQPLVVVRGRRASRGRKVDGECVLAEPDPPVRRHGRSVSWDRLRLSADVQLAQQPRLAGTDGAAEVGQYGNGWTNTFDTHLSTNNCPSSGYSYSGYYGFSVHDIDGARYDYCFNATGQLVPPAGMQGTSLVPSSDNARSTGRRKAARCIRSTCRTSAARRPRQRAHRTGFGAKSKQLQSVHVCVEPGRVVERKPHEHLRRDRCELLSATLTFATFGGQRLLRG